MKKVEIYYLPQVGWHVDYTKNNGESGSEEFLLFSQVSEFVEGRLFT